MRRILFLVSAVILLGAVTSQAQRLDPQLVNGRRHGRHAGPRRAVLTGPVDPQMYVCGFSPCTSPLGGDPNFVGSGSAVTVGFAGKHTQMGDTLIILGVPNGSAVPTITCTTGCTTANVTLLGTASFTSLSSGSAFDQFGLSSGGSESFGNWTTTPFPGGAANPDSGLAGCTVNCFTLYEFDLGAGSTLTTGNTLTFSIGNGTNGTFVLAYGCATLPVTSCSGGDIFQTVFTNTGFVDANAPPTVPEPGTLVLLGTGMLGLAKAVRRRKKQGAR